ncbi:hypothetical protein [Roseibium litorale]|uniref:Uncharacterized protein n=1 Tax=Roseibium litorale TaxID=2803841 RepID=A0ABR9CKD5_9HYPH|nr:hypothetical protein [Roseibium litorale]MBD8891307.1 hypothetical protein [Roseibium litorale]
MKTFGNISYPDNVADMYQNNRALFDLFARYFTAGYLDENFPFLRAVYSGATRQHIYDQYISLNSETYINIGGPLRDKLTAANDATPFDQGEWNTRLREAVREVELMLDNSYQLSEFWKSDEFWAFHQANGGANDFRYPDQLDSFIQNFSRDRWTAETLAEAKTLLAREGRKLTPKQLVERLEQEGRIQEKVIYNPQAAARMLGVEDAAPLQKFMEQYGYNELDWDLVLDLAQNCMSVLGIAGTPEAFLDMLIQNGFIRDKRPGAQADGTEGGDDDRSDGGSSDGDSSDGGSDGPGGGNGGNGRLSLAEFIRRLPSHVDAHIEARMGDISWAIGEGNTALITSNIAELMEDILQNADPEDARQVSRAELEAYIRRIANNRAGNQNANTETNRETGAGDPGALSLTDFMLRLPNDIEVLTRPNMGGIREALAADDEDGATGLARDLAADLCDMAGIGEDETFDIYALVGYILDLGRRQNQQAGQGGEDAREAGDDATDAGDGPLSLSEFIRRLPASADGHIQARMEDISWLIGQDNNALVTSNVRELMDYMLEQSAPGAIEQVDARELQAYIIQIARNMLASKDGSSGPGTSPGGGGGDGDDESSDGGGSGGNAPSFREAERTLSMDADDFLNNDPEEIRRAQAGGQAQAQAQAQAENGNPPPLPPRPTVARTTPVGNTPLLQLIRDARHLQGTRVVNEGMVAVRNALIQRDVNAAREAARELASALLGGPRAEPHLQAMFQQEVREVTVTILKEINGALSEDEKKPKKGAKGDDEPDPRNGPRRGPDGGNPGAGAANGSGGNGGLNGGAQQPPVTGYDRTTMDRMERQMRERSQEERRGNEDVATYAASEIKAITQLIIASQMQAAQQRAEALSKKLQSSNGEAPPMSRDEILRLAYGKAKPKTAAGGNGENGKAAKGDSDTEEVTAQLIKVVNWGNFCDVYEIDPEEIEEIKKVARKAVKDTDQAKMACKEILARRNAKAKVKIKNGRYLAEAIVHAMRMKQEKRTLRKPLKMSDIPDED